MSKLKLAVYWAAACGGCDIALVELGEKLLDLDAAADIVLWPAAMDFKYQDVEAMADNSVDLCLYNGAVRTSEQKEIAEMLRAKSKIMVAFGSCAHEGCIPGLANLKDREDIMARAYTETPSTDNGQVWPQELTEVPEGAIPLPSFSREVDTLAQTVPVDYYIPGCPPSAHQVWNVLEAIIGGEVPEPGSVVGVYPKTVCDQCPRVRENTKITEFHRPHEVIADPERCFLEQGIFCAGPATRAGCNKPEQAPLCISADMPCRGCYGPPEGVDDQGAKMVAVVASMIDSQDEEEIERILADLVDPVGTFYRFSLSDSMLRQALKGGQE